MSGILDRRVTARIEGDFVVFLIGMRINRPWKIWSWLPAVSAMPRMLEELAAAPEQTGCLGHSSLGLTTLVQYWRSFDHLERYARAKDREHWPAWVDFNRRFRDARGDVGIWHETYLVRAGEYETLYGSMPRMGLALAGRHLPVTDASHSARERLARTTSLPSVDATPPPPRA